MVKINGKNQETIIRQPADTDGIGIGAFHLADSPELYEPQRRNNFMFEISFNSFRGTPSAIYKKGLPRVGSDELLDSQSNLYFNDPDKIIKIATTGMDTPSYSQRALSVNRGNTTIRYAGKIEFGESFKLTLQDYIGAEIKDILLAWQALSGNPYTERVGHASDYKKDAFLCEYTPDGLLVRRTKILGCWVGSLSFGNFDYGQNELVKVDATIIYDRAYTDVSHLGGSLN